MKRFRLSEGPLRAGSRLAPVLALLIAAVSAIHAQNALTSKVDAYIKDEMQRQRIPGLSLAVVRNGQITLAKGYGLANIEHQVPVKPETVFQSGSMGKQFTATAIMMLVEEGKIRLDDPITKYLKDAPASWDSVSVRQLLSHTAGFTDYPDSFNFRANYTEGQLFKIIAGIPLAFPP